MLKNVVKSLLYPGQIIGTLLKDNASWTQCVLS